MRLFVDLCRWLYWFPFRKLIQVLPYPVIISIAKALGAFIHALHRPFRQVVNNELIAFPSLNLDEKMLSQATKKGLQQKMLSQFETFLFKKMNRQWVERYTRIDGLELLDQALEKGKGAIILIAHFGANQMIMPMLGHRGYKVNQIGAQPGDFHRIHGIKPSKMEQRIFNLRKALEDALPAHIHHIKTSMRPVFRALHAGEILIIAYEGRGGGKWMQTSILGRTASISAGPYFIAKRTGAPILPAFHLRDDKGCNRLIIHQPIKIPIELETDIFDGNQCQFALLLGDYIQHYPEYYTPLLYEAARRQKIDDPPLFSRKDAK